MSGRPSPNLRAVASHSDLDRNPAGVSSGAMNSPSLKSRGQKAKRFKQRPQVKRSMLLVHKLIFSVDDDVNEDEEDSSEQLQDADRKYLEGYHDALSHLHQHKKKSTESPGIVTNEASFEAIPTPSRIVDDVPNNTIEMTDEDAPGLTNINEDDDAASAHTSSSSETLESLNLKDRQAAINSTHPFGIKIWKPSIYKKNRSVAARAEEDIHSYDPRKTGKIFIGVHISNFIWSCTVGAFLYLVCFLGAVCVFLLSGFAWHKQSRPYVSLLLSLGRYFLFPFGKFVLLKKDKNYLEEDELDGRSISEFHRWRMQEEGRLFFAPPRRMTNSESKPLLKDHKGRPLRDAYSSLGEGQSEQVNDAENVIDNADENDAENSDIKVRFFGRGSWSSGRFMFYIFFYGILQPVLYLISFFSWLFVFTIPMTNLILILCDHLRRRPLALQFEREKTYYKKVKDPQQKKFYPGQSIILNTYRCCGWHYYKYTIDGTNVFFINLLLVVVLVIADYYLLKEYAGVKMWFTDSSFLFCSCLVSIIPLAYFIGQAVASISAQSSMGVGAVINAFFSTVVEIFLYCVALNQAKGKLVEGSMIGSILGGVLLLPGLSMCGGALKRKTQRYNPRSAGVSSTMLLFAMVVMFAPSLFYQMYGSYELQCRDCGSISDSSSLSGEDCTTCRFIQPLISLDKLYYQILRPFSLLVAVALFLAYICGLYFTLRTHASLIWATNSHEQQAAEVRRETLTSPSLISLDTPPKPDHSGDGRTQGLILPKQNALNLAIATETSKHRVANTGAPPTPSLYRESNSKPVVEELDEGGHDAPNWSQTKSSVILLGATVLYAIIAEILVDNVDAVLSHFPINPKFLGLTVFALVPNTTEFVNAISFAVSGNVALSMEIGSAYALQVVLIQIPSLVVYSVFKGFENPDMIFSLIFPRWDIVATLASIYLFTYIYAEGKSNYFKGVILILIYVVVLVAFYLDDMVASLEDGFH